LALQEGISNLEYLPNGNNVPVNEPWIYDPEGPVGFRFKRTGVYTRFARLYHATALLTSAGDVIVAGETLSSYLAVVGGHA
jgi:hypothetical protein